MENQPNRLTVTEIKNEALRFFNLEKGIPFTFLSLFKNPYQTVQNYLYKNRRVVNNPLQYLFFSIAVYMLMSSFHPSFKEFAEKADTQNQEMFRELEEQTGKEMYVHFKKAQEISFSTMNFVYLLALPIMSLLTFWFFRSKYNYAENLAINCYMYGTANWVSFLILVCTVFFKLPGYFMYFLMLFTFIITSYMLKYIYQLTWLKAITTGVLLNIIFVILVQVYLTSIFVYFLLTS